MQLHVVTQTFYSHAIHKLFFFYSDIVFSHVNYAIGITLVSNIAARITRTRHSFRDLSMRFMLRIFRLYH